MKMVLQNIKQAAAPWHYDILAIFIVIGLFFFFKIGGYPLQVPDEARYSEIPREMVVSGDYITPRLNGVKYFEKPPLFYWLQSSAIKLFGVSEGVLRLWTALLGLFGCLMTYGVGRVLYGRAVGLVSCLVLASSVLYFIMSHSITLDMALSIFISACLFSFLLGTRQSPHTWQRCGWFLACYGFAACAVLTKGLIGLLLPGAVVFIWLMVTHSWHQLKQCYLLSGILLFLVITLPWHVVMQMRHPEFFQFYILEQQILRYFTDISQRTEPFWFYLPMLLGGLFPWSVFLIQACVQPGKALWLQPDEHRELKFFILWAGLIFIFFSVSQSKLIPYILPMFPALAIIIGRYLVIAWHRKYTLRVGFWIFVGFSVIIAIAAFFLPRLVVRTEQTFMQNYIWSIGGLFLLAGIGVAWLILKKKSIHWGLTILLAMTVILQLQFITVWPRLDDRSIKPLVNVLDEMEIPTEQVIAYHNYYQDLPLYLGDIITLVNPRGEIREGLAWEDTSAWVIDESVFRQRWDSDEPIYIITPHARLEQLMKQDATPAFVISHTRRHVLATNQKAGE